MSDSKPPKPAKPQFLPRTWKAEPEPPAEPEPAKPAKKSKSKGKDAQAADPTEPAKKKKKKPAEAEFDDGTGASKLEETPLLDTYEARQRVRYAIGGALSLMALVTIIVLVNKFQPSPAKPEANPERVESRPPVDPKESAEHEAAAMIQNAREFDKLGRVPASIALLQKVVRNYEGTESARVAAAALDRDRHNRPLFDVDAAKHPTGPTPPARPPTGPPPAGATVAGPIPPAGPVPPAASPATAPKPPEIVARPLPSGFRADTTAPLHASGWPMRITCDRDGAPMVLVPGGEFLMGRDDGESSERPSHRVKLSTFYIDEHEVTNRQYQLYLKETGRPELTRSEATEGAEAVPADRLDLPATGLTAQEARAYCYWANRRLPTEAQWELAARSADGRVAYSQPKAAAKGKAATARTLEPVMAAATDRSPCGAFDLAGNAWEWTGDYYDSKYYYSLRGLTVDPTGPAQSRMKPSEATVKGGSEDGYLTWRRGWKIEGKTAYLGFRGALPADPPVVSAPVVPVGQPGVNPPGGAVPF